MATDQQLFGTGYKGTTRQRRRRGNRIAQHEGRTPQPGIPTGDRNRAATERARALVTPRTAAEIPTSTRRLHEGRVNQPGVIGKRVFGVPSFGTLAPAQPLLSGLGLGLEHSITPEIAAQQAYETGAPLAPKQRRYIRGVDGKATIDAIEHLRAQGRDEALKEPADLTNAILLASGVGDLVGLAGRGAIDEAAGVGAGAAAREATGAASEKATGNAIRDALGAAGAKKAAAVDAVKQAVRDAEPEAVKAAREKGAQAAHAFADRTPEPVKIAGKVAGKTAAYPLRHPIVSPIALQIPTAIIQRKPGALEAGFTGTGNYANITGAVSGALSHVSPILGEAVSLPASALPSAYLAGKAAYNAANGNDAEAKALLAQWEQTGVLPKLAQGDVSGAVQNLGAHPLYDALELSGAANVGGRALGTVSRALPGKFGELDRPDLPIRGTNVNVKREYSRDAVRQALQRAYDKTSRGSEARADTRRGAHLLKEAANRLTSGQEAVRREHAHQDMKALKKSLPKKFGRLDRHSAEVVNLAVERIIQHPDTFNKDLSDYRELLLKAREARTEDGKPALDQREMKANRELVKQVEKAMKRGHPGHVVDAADSFIKLQEPILHELIDLGLLTKEQAAKASATSFARVHLGAGHDEKLGVVDEHGQPLTLKQIETEMQSRGLEPPGFLSHRAPANSDFYQPSFGGATLEKGGRTGRAVVSGSQLGGIEGLVRQLRRSRGLVDRARAWNKAVDRFGVEVKGVDTAADAKKVQADPARYGLDPSVQPVAVPRYPFLSKKQEIEGALENQSPSVAEESAGATIMHGIDEAARGVLPKDSKVVFMPKTVVDQLRADAEPSGQIAKIGQVATTGLRRAVLPFSVSWYAGNFLDNAIRTTLAGVNPAHLLLGVKAHHALNTEQRAELVGGAHFASVEAVAPHRSVESIITGHDQLSKAVRGYAEWSRKHGPAQAAVKFIPEILNRLSHYLVTTNAAVTEMLPQYGLLGKLMLKDIRKTQGSWRKAMTHFDEAVDSFAKGLNDPDKMIRAQKDLEAVYGNYVRMSPAARKFLSTVSPFWTWYRAAMTFTYLTMPLHHSVATAFLAAAANATRAEREQYGLEKGQDRALPSYYNGIPLPGGRVFPLASYDSFDYASDPIEATAKLPVPQVRNILEALSGRNWKGEQIPGGEGGKVLGALEAAGGNFIPLANTFLQEEEGRPAFKPHLSVPHVLSKGQVEKAREPWETISVPASDGSGEEGFGGGASFGEAWADRGEKSAGSSFAEAWADR